MSNYKLTYFNLTALGEPIRFLLSYAGIDFEDNRITHADWPALKPKTPLAQLPTLEIDGKTLYQSNAISRFLAKKFNLNGSNEFEAFQVDATIETIGDLRTLLAKWFFNANPTEKSATEAETREKAAFYLDKLETAIKKNGGYLVGGKLSGADFVLAALSGFLSHMAGRNLFEDYPKVQGLIDKVFAQPKVKSYVAKRPQTDF